MHALHPFMNNPLTRRYLLQQSGYGLGAIALSELLSGESNAADNPLAPAWARIGRQPSM